MEATDVKANSDRLLPFSQARDLVGISRSQVYVLLEQGDFPNPAKIGRCNYFSEKELQAWIEEKLSHRNSETPHKASV